MLIDNAVLMLEKNKLKSDHELSSTKSVAVQISNIFLKLKRHFKMMHSYF